MNKFQEIAKTMKFTELPAGVVKNSDFEYQLRRNVNGASGSSSADMESPKKQDKENHKSG